MHIALLPSVVAFLGRDHSNFIDGAAHTSASTQRIGVVDPGTALGQGLTPDAAAAMGLRPGTAVAAGVAVAAGWLRLRR